MIEAGPSNRATHMQDSTPKEEEEEAELQRRNVDYLLSEDHGKAFVGREAERDALLCAYQRVRGASSSVGNISTNKEVRNSRKNEFVLISGQTGVGKTTLAHSIREQVIATNGFFVSGKFDQMQRPDQSSAFGDALTEYVGQVLERNDALSVREALRRQGIDSATGGKELVVLVPALKNVLVGDKGEDEKSVAEEGQLSEEEFFSMRTNATVLHFKHLCRLFIRAISNPEKPLLLLLDDMHFADEASVDLLHFLLDDTFVDGGVLFVGTCNDYGPSGTHRIENMMKTLNKSKVSTTYLRLQPLREHEVRCLLEQVLPMDKHHTARLATVVHSIVCDNIFFVFELLHSFVENNVLIFKEGRLECDLGNLEEFQIEFGEMKDLLLAKISRLSNRDKEVLKIAACLGSRLDPTILQFFMSEPIEAFFREGSEKGLLRYNKIRKSWSFAHDTIQETIYQLIPANDRMGYHYRIARKLWRALDERELSDFIFLVAGELVNAGNSFKDDRERVAVAELCLSASIKGVSISSFQTSYDYLKHGILLLGHLGWQEQYELWLALQSAAAEVANCLGYYENALEHIENVLEHARNFHDTFRAQGVKVHTIGSRGMCEEALIAGIDFLSKLGIHIPSKPSKISIFLEWKSLQRMLRKRTNESLMRLPPMCNKEMIAAMQMLNLMLLYGFLAHESWLPVLGFKMVRLTLNHGLSSVSCIGFGVYSVVNCAFAKDFDEGERFGRLSFSLYKHFNARGFLARVSAIHYEGVHSWKKPVADMFGPLERAYHFGLGTGDTEFALLCASISWYTRVELESLVMLDQEMASLSERMELHRQTNVLLINRPAHQMMRNLIGLDSGDVTVLLGDVLDENATKEIKRNHIANLWLNVHTVILCCLFGQYKKAKEVTQLSTNLESAVFGPMGAGVVFFFFGFADVAYARHRKKARAPLAQKHAKRLGNWSLQSPHNFLGKHLLLKAELAAMTQCKSTVSRYVNAIAASREGGFIGQTALANERLAWYLIDRGDGESSKAYFTDALSLYNQWGALVKVRQLQEAINSKMLDVPC